MPTVGKGTKRARGKRAIMNRRGTASADPLNRSAATLAALPFSPRATGPDLEMSSRLMALAASVRMEFSRLFLETLGRCMGVFRHCE